MGRWDVVGWEREEAGDVERGSGRQQIRRGEYSRSMRGTPALTRLYYHILSAGRRARQEGVSAGEWAGTVAAFGGGCMAKAKPHCVKAIPSIYHAVAINACSIMPPYACLAHHGVQCYHVTSISYERR